MPTRYGSYEIIRNSTDYYSPLRKKRNTLKAIEHYETPYMHHPGVLERAMVPTQTYIWKLGDHYYKLADAFYNDTRYWWAIAWYNGYPTEADISIGDVIEVPLSISDLLSVLGV
jgi:hypothetical protein